MSLESVGETCVAVVLLWCGLTRCERNLAEIHPAAGRAFAGAVMVLLGLLILYRL